MEYESVILKRLIDTYGVVGNPRYISEIIKEFIIQGKERYPELFTYQADWLAHIDEFGLNPSYTVSYTGQSIYAPNTLERPVKSAILKGQTLVNVYDYTSSTFIGGVTIENGVITFKAGGGWVVVNNKLPMLKPNTNYTVFVNILSNTLNYSSTVLDYALRVEGDTGNSGFITGFDIPKGSVGIFKKLLTTKESLSTTNLSDVRIPFTADSGEIKFNYMIIEGDHTQEDISYFEGMQSVKMPVLTTTGKNLIGNLVYGNVSSDGIILDNKGQKRVRTDYITISSAGAYRISNHSDEIGVIITFTFDENKKLIRNGGWNTSHFDSQHTFNNNEKYIIIEMVHDLTHTVDIDITKVKIQFEQNTLATTYEPHKSNILTVNEDVTLRSNGYVCDELNLLTGRLTQRIDKNNEVLAQAVVKTVDLTILDQNGQNVKQLMSFNGGTHFNTGSLEGSLIPSVSVTVETDLEETLKVCSLEGNTM